MGKLVFAYGHGVCLVEHYIAGHKYGIAHQAIVDILRLHPGLLLESGHTQQPAQGGRHAQQDM